MTGMTVYVAAMIFTAVMIVLMIVLFGIRCSKGPKVERELTENGFRWSSHDQVQRQAAETRRKCNEYAKTAPETPDFSVNSDNTLTAVLQELYNAAVLESQINALAEELKEEEAK